MDWSAEGLDCEVTVAPERIATPGTKETDTLGPDQLRDTGEWPSATVSLRGRAVLLVEDEPLVAMEMAQTLISLGCDVVGPAATLNQALRLADDEARRLDMAVLDVNLHGRSAFPVAARLARQGTPVVWATGYGELPPGHSGGHATELLRKPLAEGELEAAPGTWCGGG